MQHINETLQGEYLSGNTKPCRLFVVVGSVVVGSVVVVVARKFFPKLHQNSPEVFSNTAFDFLISSS